MRTLRNKRDFGVMPTDQLIVIWLNPRRAKAVKRSVDR